MLSTALIILAAFASPAQAQTKLLFNMFWPPSFFMTPVMHQWAAEVEKATAGRVQIEFAAGSLAPPPQQLSGVQSGIFDISVAANPFIKNKAPLIEFSSLPWLIQDAEAASVAMWRTYEKKLAGKKQFADVHLLSLFQSTGGELYSLSDTPIDSMNELKSRKMWALPGEAADLLKSIGMNPITSPAVQITESVSRGVVDGYYGLSLDGAASFKATPYTKVVTLFPLAATSTSFSLFINKAKWASLSEQDRAAIMSVSGEKMAALVGRASNKSATEALAKMKADGIKVVYATPAFYTAMQKAAVPSFKQYEAIAAKHGVDGKAVIDYFKKQYAALAKP
ncbi:MAG TPA: TRAP transporter substrate-binding protein DctP [Rhodocyclaceae bacterium]|nr:TRAP transporter substrate-binding protein DctP [Rhodocyclaceae bacterium]